MFSSASPLELVLLFLVAVVGLPSLAVAVCAVAEVALYRMRCTRWDRQKAERARAMSGSAHAEAAAFDRRLELIERLPLATVLALVLFAVLLGLMQ